MKSNCGYYQVGSKKFFNKNSAIYEASTTKKEISWHFHDNVFDKCLSKTKLGNKNLNTLYKERAQQLRDSYDYLILNYSGGPDSHNILMTFINNNIRLDEIHVKYSNSVDKKIYTPNRIELGAENIHSEYDYVIKPNLEKLKITNPEIKIDIHDVFENIPNLSYDTFINAPSHYLGAFELLRQSKYSNSINIQLDKGKKVADIYGIDKPILFVKDNFFYTIFIDTTVSVAGTRHEHIELFYWTPDFPEIVLEQAFAVYKFFINNPSMIPIIDLNLRDPNDLHRIELLRKIAIKNIYTTFDLNTFQVCKPTAFSISGRSRDKYYINNPLFADYLTKYNHYAKTYGNSLDKKYFDINYMLNKTFYSKWHKIGELN